MKRRNQLWIFLSIALVTACSKPKEVTWNLDGQRYIVPLVNTSVGLLDAGENPTDNVSVEMDEEGLVTVNYEGEVLYEDTGDIFFPFPILSYFPLTDTVAPLLFPVPDEVVIEKAVFADFADISFKFQHQEKEDIDVDIVIEDFTKDGEPFRTSTTIPYDGAETTIFETPFSNLDDWVYDGDNNSFIVNYDARNGAGERLKLDSVHMYVQAIHFKFGQGFFGRRTYNIKKDIIDVGIFNKWLSGGFTFLEPKVTMLIENSFGFPVTAIFNTIELTSINDNVFFLESDILSEGIDFGYPTLDEMGEIKYTSFDFTNDNSNITEIFNEKTKNVYYDLEASTNPQEENIIGFYNEDSYYKVDIAVEVPLVLEADELILTDTVGFDIGNQFDEIEDALLWLKVKNEFPVDIRFLAKILDEDGHTLALIPAVDMIDIPGYNIEREIILDLTDAQLESLRSGSSIAFLGRFNTAGTASLKADQRMDVQLGIEVAY